MFDLAQNQFYFRPVATVLENAKILIVGGEQDSTSLLAGWLRKEKSDVTVIPSGEAALQVALSQKFRLIIVNDWLSGMSSEQFCKTYRRMEGRAPLMMLTRICNGDFTVHALDTGFDDCVTIPADFKELSLRMRALIRRPPNFGGPILRVGSLEYNTITRQLSSHGIEVKLLPREMAIVEFFMRHPGKFFRAEDILDFVWAADSDSSPETVRTHIKNLRKKIDRLSTDVELSTIRGVGYKLSAIKHS